MIQLQKLQKPLKKVVSFLTSPFLLGLLVTLGITYLSILYYADRHESSSSDKSGITQFIRELHEKTIDWRLRDRGPQPGSDRVAILAVDERSIELEGRWPWPRDKMAHVVDRAIEAGAKEIAFDIIFSEEDTNSSIPSLMRLRRNLAREQKLTPDFDALLNQEMERANADRIFADTIKKNSDHLILGAYTDIYAPETRKHHHPYTDLCLDALFERTYESRYWKKEAIPLTVVDAPLNQLKVPREIKDHLSDYFTQLEVTAASRWFEKNPKKTQDITEALAELGDPLPPEAYPGVATLWINGNNDIMAQMLQEAKPELATPEGVQKLFQFFASGFSKKEAAELTGEIRTAGEAYCARFFTPNDDLLSYDAFKSVWGEGEDLKAMYEEISWSSLWSKLQGSNPDLKTETLDAAADRFRSLSLDNSITQVARYWVNIPSIAEGTKHSGYFDAVQDTDGSIRRSRLIVRRGNNYTPSLAFKTFLVDQGYSASAQVDVEDVGRAEAATKIIKSLEALDTNGDTALKIPVDGQGHLMINYAGGRHMFPYVSAADLLSDSPDVFVEQQKLDPSTGRWNSVTMRVNKKTFFKDKILIAGATATGVYDLRVTPFEENYPGVETHANVLSNLLVENARAKGENVKAPGFLRTHPKEERLMWIVLLGIGIALSALLSWVGSVTGLGLTALALAGVYAIDKFYFFRNGIVITVFFPMLLVSVNFVSLTFYKYFTEERKKRELKGTFEKYVSPAIVAEVLSDPENIELGGKKMELTVMFSDVRGFTTISEKLDPRALSDLLNSYLTPMTDLVFKNKGTLDKYMGDAIMAFWGAPIHFPDHAHHACRCALQMIKKLKELQDVYRAKGLPEIDIGIGLNTGDMSVGNMGSDTVRSYTVMGDAVNLGSRLEGINKQYGTRIIISEFTYEAIKDTFVTREVDWVRVKGKAQPVRIFELIAEGKVPEATLELVRLFHQGFELYHARQFEKAIEAFNQALQTHPDDAVTHLYIERCQDYLKEPPPENWDGVFTMTSK